MVVVEFGLQSSCHLVALLLHENSSETFKLTVQIMWTKNVRPKRVFFRGVCGECESQQMLTLMVLKPGLVPSCCILPYLLSSRSQQSEDKVNYSHMI